METTAVLEKIAENSGTDVETLVRLASNPSVEVRMAVAENANTPLSTLLLLVNDESPDVRYRLAENYNAPCQVLEALVDDTNPYVSWRALTTIRRIQTGQPEPQWCAALRDDPPAPAQ